MSLKSINPATGEVIKVYEEYPWEKVAQILEKSGRGFQQWRSLSLSDRAARFKKASAILRAKNKELALLMAEEMGKPLVQGESEIEKCAWVCDHYADEAEDYLTSVIIQTDATKSYVAFEPLGVVLSIMPWNFPFWQVFRCVAPALMAGNAVVLKHASNVTGCALAIEDIFKKSGLEDTFHSLVVDTAAVSKLIEHSVISAVALTGSVGAGKAVGAKSGEMLKKCVLELGGSDPYLILDDADLEQTVLSCVTSRLINSGQSCIAAKRFIVVRPVAQKFLELFMDSMKAQTIGSPLEAGVTVGPLARMDLRDGIHRQVEESVRRGAKVVLGGKIPSGKGAYYPPTILTHVKKGMPAYDEELFGPVASVIEVENEDEAVRVANDTIFGLGAAVFTRDAKRGERVAHRIEAGSCFVNAHVRSDPRLPFGGIKESGYGRELSSFGIHEFVNIKTVYIK